MRKVFELENLDCAHCAARMEDAISKIDGVDYVAVRFMTQKLVIEADQAHMEAIVDEAIETCRRIDPELKVKRRFTPRGTDGTVVRS